jgi:hypothetical protein
MQRVLYEILRRSCDNTDRTSKKRKSSALLPSNDGKFAEQLYDRETRGARPGLIDWTVKRKRTDDWGTLMGKRMYTEAH